MPSALTGPCSNPHCKAKFNPSGQWQFIPEDNTADTNLEYPSGQTCKKAACLRHFGLKPPKEKPGRKRRHGKRSVGGGGDDDDEDDYRPPKIGRMIEIWSTRCACLLCRLPACLVPASLLLKALRRTFRDANLAKMNAEERGNTLDTQDIDTMKAIEYCVHGLYYRSENDVNGFYSSFWWTVAELRSFFERSTVFAILEEYHNKVNKDFEAELDWVDAEREEAEAGGEESE